MDEHRTTEAFLTLLSEAFPAGDDESRRKLYIDQIRRADIDPADLAEAVQRIIHVRESRTFPQIAEILRHAREARVDRLRVKHDGPPLLTDGMVRYGALHRREIRVWRELAVRGVTFCDIDNVWLEGRHCLHDPTCHGATVHLPEAEEKLAWAEENREIDPRRLEWQESLEPGVKVALEAEAIRNRDGDPDWAAFAEEKARRGALT